jgi:DinB family
MVDPELLAASSNSPPTPSPAKLSPPDAHAASGCPAHSRGAVTTEQLLTKMLPIRTTQISFANLLQHLTNHSTYHRGQIALMMWQVGGKPMAIDFHRSCSKTVAKLHCQHQPPT